jgi:hypothetical protein
LIPLTHVSLPPKRHRRRKYANNSKESDEDDFDEKEEEYICVEDAAKVIRDDLTDTFASSSTEAAVWDRISRQEFFLVCVALKKV